MPAELALKKWNRTSDYTNLVSANIRAECARQGLNITGLAKALGANRSAIGFRWRDERPWQLEEIAAVADVLGLEPWQLSVPSENAKRPSGTVVDLMDVRRARRDSNPQPSDP